MTNAPARQAWFHFGTQRRTVDRMGEEVPVRIPADLLSFLDKLVAEGEAADRGEALVRLLRRGERHWWAEREDMILTAMEQSGERDEGLDIAAWRSANPLDLSDLD